MKYVRIGLKSRHDNFECVEIEWIGFAMSMFLENLFDFIDIDGWPEIIEFSQVQALEVFTYVSQHLQYFSILVLAKQPPIVIFYLLNFYSHILFVYFTHSILEIAKEYQPKASLYGQGCVWPDVDIFVDSFVGES